MNNETVRVRIEKHELVLQAKPSDYCLALQKIQKQ